ncbi:MAG TPA: DUF2231 domain-containing protein [Terriglobia bacterium]|nr:DUF2231 domain-containing protein [Terriglobia bacterium]
MFGVPYHFFLVHFPVVLVLLALFYDLRGLFDFGYRLTLGAAAGALFASTTGLMLAGGNFSRMTVHAGASLLGSLCIVALGMLRYSRKAREEEPLKEFPTPWLLLEIFAAACVIVALVTGHRAVLGLE